MLLTLKLIGPLRFLSPVLGPLPPLIDLAKNSEHQAVQLILDSRVAAVMKRIDFRPAPFVSQFNSQLACKCEL